MLSVYVSFILFYVDKENRVAFILITVTHKDTPVTGIPAMGVSIPFFIQ